MRSKAFALGVLVFLHFVLALGYAYITPYRASGVMYGAIANDVGAPDESRHANYIQSLISGQGFPVLKPGDPNLGETYESHQPPLYYVLSAGFCKITGVDNVADQSAGLKLRAFNALFGCANVLGVFFLCLWGFERRDLALCAAAFTALLPMNVSVSGAISNDPLFFALCTWSLAVASLCLRQGWTMKRSAALGILLGLAFLTKGTSLGLVPAILIGAYAFKDLRPQIKYVGVAAIIALVLVAPWWLRNQQLYGDPLAIKAFNSSFVGSPTQTSLGITSSWDYWTHWVGWTLARSMVGVFGYMNIYMKDDFYRVAVAVILIIGLGGFLSMSKPEWKGYKPIHLLNAAFLIVIVILFVGFNIKFYQAQARYVFPAIGPISAGLGLGILYFSKDRWKTSFIAWVTVLSALNLYILLIFLPNQFAKEHIGIRDPGLAGAALQR